MLLIMPDLEIPSALAARLKPSPRWIIALLMSRSRKNAPLTPVLAQAPQSRKAPACQTTCNDRGLFLVERTAGIICLLEVTP
jgi:hypothetical protein